MAYNNVRSIKVHKDMRIEMTVRFSKKGFLNYLVDEKKIKEELGQFLNWKNDEGDGFSSYYAAVFSAYENDFQIWKNE